MDFESLMQGVLCETGIVWTVLCNILMYFPWFKSIVGVSKEDFLFLLADLDKELETSCLHYSNEILATKQTQGRARSLTTKDQLLFSLVKALPLNYFSLLCDLPFKVNNTSVFIFNFGYSL
jgi:hypothetical protein